MHRVKSGDIRGKASSKIVGISSETELRAKVEIAFPAGVDGDLSREAVWAAMEVTGWRPVSQIAIDKIWPALRFRPTQEVKSRK